MSLKKWIGGRVVLEQGAAYNFAQFQIRSDF